MLGLGGIYLHKPHIGVPLICSNWMDSSEEEDPDYRIIPLLQRAASHLPQHQVLPELSRGRELTGRTHMDVNPALKSEPNSASCCARSGNDLPSSATMWTDSGRPQTGHPDSSHPQRKQSGQLQSRCPDSSQLSNHSCSVPADECEQQPSSSDDSFPLTSQNKMSSGNLVIKVIGDHFGNDVSQNAVMQQLRQKLGVKVIVQMENSEGEVVFEDHGNGFQISGPDIKKESNGVNSIVKTVMSTIRDLSAQLEKHEVTECPICGDTVTGYHYGVPTCESCKGFFKRTVQNKKAFTCHRDGTCEIVLSNRKKCPACRFQKCCDVGMKVEGIREDRSRGGRSTYDGASLMMHRRRSNSLTVTDTPQKKGKPDEAVSAGSPTPPPSLLKPIIPELMEQIYALEPLYEEEDNMPMECCRDRLTMCDQHKFSSMLHITEHRLYQIVRWARHLPNFLHVHTDDQILLLQNAWAELVCLGAIWRSRYTPGVIQLSFGKTIDLVKAREMQHEEVISRMLHVCENLRRLEVDRYEYVCLKVLALLLPDIKGLKEPNVVQEYQARLLDALNIYTSTHYPSKVKFGELLLRLSEVQRLTAISRSQILDNYSAGKLPMYSLLMELLRGQGHGSGNVLTTSQAEYIINSNFSAESIVPNHQEGLIDYSTRDQRSTESRYSSQATALRNAEVQNSINGLTKDR